MCFSVGLLDALTRIKASYRPIVSIDYAAEPRAFQNALEKLPSHPRVLELLQHLFELEREL
jgi:hypothetical protein